MNSLRIITLERIFMDAAAAATPAIVCLHQIEIPPRSFVMF
jgi:hypothetical protein